MAGWHGSSTFLRGRLTFILGKSGKRIFYFGFYIFTKEGIYHKYLVDATLKLIYHALHNTLPCFKLIFSHDIACVFR